MTKTRRGRGPKPRGDLRAWLKAALSGEDGMTLAEMLVAMFIFAILGTLAFTTVINGSLNLKTVRQNTDLNEQARGTLNRMTRELRQASAITAVVNPDGLAGADVALTFEVNFNDEPGHEAIEPDAEDAERLTYRYDAAGKRLLVQTQAQSTPVLSANVTSFKLTYRSSKYNCDANNDGQVTWQELETAPRPPCTETSIPNSTLDEELRSIDQVIIDMTLETGKRAQKYRTKIDLRNRG